MDNNENEPGAIPAVKHVNLPITVSEERSENINEGITRKWSSSSRLIEEEKKEGNESPLDETKKVEQLMELDHIVAQLHDEDLPKAGEQTKSSKIESTPSGKSINKTMLLGSQSKKSILKDSTASPSTESPHRLSVYSVPSAYNVPPARPPLVALATQTPSRVSPLAVPSPVRPLPVRPSPTSSPGRPPLPMAPTRGLSTKNREQAMYEQPQVSDVTSDTEYRHLMMPTPVSCPTTSGSNLHPISSTVPSKSTKDSSSEDWSNNDYNSDEDPELPNYKRSQISNDTAKKELNAQDSKNTECICVPIKDIEQECSPVKQCFADAATMAEEIYSSVGEGLNEDTIVASLKNSLTDMSVSPKMSLGRRTEETLDESPRGIQSEAKPIVKEVVKPKSALKPFEPPPIKDFPYEHSEEGSYIQTSTSVSLLAEVEVSRDTGLNTISYTEVDPTMLEQDNMSTLWRNRGTAPTLGVLDVRENESLMRDTSLSGKSNDFSYASYTMSVSGESTITSTYGPIDENSPGTPDPRLSTSQRSLIQDDVPSDPVSDAILKGAALIGFNPKSQSQDGSRAVHFETESQSESKNYKVDGDNNKLNTSHDTNGTDLNRSFDDFNDEEKPPVYEKRKVNTDKIDSSPAKKSKRTFYILIATILVLVIGVIGVIFVILAATTDYFNSSAVLVSQTNISSSLPSFLPSSSPILEPLNISPVGILVDSSASNLPSDSSSEPNSAIVEVSAAPTFTMIAVSNPSNNNSPTSANSPTVSTASPTRAQLSSPTMLPTSTAASSINSTTLPISLPVASRKELFQGIFDSMIYTNVNYNDQSPEGQALVWIVDEDTRDPLDSTDENKKRITQRYALMTLYYASYNSDWVDEFNWRNEDECTWAGISCEDTTIVRVVMENYGITGTLSPDLAMLSNLDTLILNGNRIQGSIPESFKRLEKLRIIALKGNFMTGQLNDFDFPELENLRVLDLKDNQFSGVFPSMIYEMNRLTFLDFENNMLTGELLEDIGRMRNIIRFSIGNNEMSGEVPTQIGRLSSATTFNIENNWFNGTIPSEVSNMESLLEFVVGSNYLNGEIPSTLGLLKDIEILSLEYNLNTGLIPKSFSNLSNLKNLRLGGNRLDWNPFPEYVYDFQDLIVLQLENCGLTGTLSEDIRNLENLISLRLDNNALNKTLPSVLGELGDLQALRLDSNSFSGTIPAELGNLLRLIDLRVNYNLLSGSIPNAIGNLMNLEHFTVGTNNLLGSIPDAITNLKKLKFFGCEDTYVEGTIPYNIGNMEALEVFRVYLNRWDSVGVKGLTGTIPSSIGNLQNLRLFFVYQNSLDGKIPEEIGNCRSIEILDLESNKLEGVVPGSLGNLKNLRILRVGGNKDLRELPSSVCELDSLNIYRSDCARNCTCCTVVCGFRPLQTVPGE